MGRIKMDSFAKKNIIVLICSCVVAFAVCGCGDRARNEFSFPPDGDGWYVIVNGAVDGKTFAGKDVRRFSFDSARILVVDIEGFGISSKKDAFVSEGRIFNPDRTDTDSIKLCYYMGSRNSGYNPDYFIDRSKVTSATPKGIQNFDLYFFKVSKRCEAQSQDLNEFWDSVWRFLAENGVHAKNTNNGKLQSP